MINFVSAFFKHRFCWEGDDDAMLLGLAMMMISMQIVSIEEINQI